jgi:hypothetical protein
METLTLKSINKLLNNAPKSVQERVLGYIEGLVENENIHFQLTELQKKNLMEIKNRPHSEHSEIENFMSKFTSEYAI